MPTSSDGYNMIQLSMCGNHTGSTANDRIVIVAQSGCSMMIHGVGGRNIYTVSPGVDVKITILDFNVTMDRIDLSKFRTVRVFSDVILSRGSVIIDLPQSLRIVLQKCNLDQVTEKMFIFEDKPWTVNVALQIYSM